MADVENEFPLGYVDKRRNAKGQEVVGDKAAVNLAASAASWRPINVGAMRARLAVLNAAYYTDARLNGMTKNDLVYAVRQLDDAAGIK